MNPLKKIWQELTCKLGGKFLCDTCRNDYGNVCKRPERPNSTHCPDYQKGGHR